MYVTDFLSIYFPCDLIFLSNGVARVYITCLFTCAPTRTSIVTSYSRPNNIQSAMLFLHFSSASDLQPESIQTGTAYV